MNKIENYDAFTKDNTDNSQKGTVEDGISLVNQDRSKHKQYRYGCMEPPKTLPKVDNTFFIFKKIRSFFTCLKNFIKYRIWKDF